MLLALPLLLAFQPGLLDAPIVRLSQARGAFERDYVPPKRESLHVVEELGTNGLGNPGRLWLYPAGSAKYRVWLCTYSGYSGPETGPGQLAGYLVYQSRHGKITTTDWALKLTVAGKNARATGTLSKFIKLHKLQILERTSAKQRALLAQNHAYVAMSPGRGEHWGLFTWFVDMDGRRAKTYYACWPEPTVDVQNRSTSIDLNRVLFAPPITKEEIEALNLPVPGNTTWHGPGKFKLESYTDYARWDFAD